MGLLAGWNMITVKRWERMDVVVTLHLIAWRKDWWERTNVCHVVCCNAVEVEELKERVY